MRRLPHKTETRRNDYRLGDEPLMLAHVVDHPGLLGVLGFFGAFIVLGFAPAMVPALLLALLNDFKYTTRKNQFEPDTIEVDAEELEYGDEVRAPQRSFDRHPHEPKLLPRSSGWAADGLGNIDLRDPVPMQASRRTRPTIYRDAPVLREREIAYRDNSSPAVQTTTTALNTILASPYTSRAIFGAQRTGKSYLAAIASQQLSNKGVSIFHLNLSSYGDEDLRYWGHAKRSLCGDLTAVDNHQGLSLIREAIALVTEWWSIPNAILIVDEWGHLGSSSNSYRNELSILLKLIADKISCVASTGIKRRQAIWTISPEFVAGAMEQDAKAIKKLQVCLLAIPKGKSIDWHGSEITFNDELYDQIAKNYTIKPYEMSSHLSRFDRVAYVNGLWIPVGLEGHGLNPLINQPSDVRNQPMSILQTKQETKPLTERILAYLSKANEPLPTWKIRNGCTRSSDSNREDTAQVKDALCLLASECKVEKIEEGNRELWILF